MPAAEFQVADAGRFRVPAKFDAAVSTFDSLNHILSLEDLQAAFRRIAAALEPGAPFAFDMLSGNRLPDPLDRCLLAGARRPRADLCRRGLRFRHPRGAMQITMFRRLDGEWRRFDTVIRERCHPPGEVDAALRQAGFGAIRREEARDLGMPGRLGEGRTFFVAAKTESIPVPRIL